MLACFLAGTGAAGTIGFPEKPVKIGSLHARFAQWVSSAKPDC